jgi:hypothetical protein
VTSFLKIETSRGAVIPRRTFSPATESTDLYAIANHALAQLHVSISIAFSSRKPQPPEATVAVLRSE